MNKIQSVITVLGAVLLGALQFAQAGTTNIYSENWGTGNTGGGNGTLNTVGWTAVAVSETAGPYLGIYTANPTPSDAGTGAPLPANTVYFTVLVPTQTTPGMFYTTDASGSGSFGNSSFVDVNPTLYTNLTLSAEVRDDGGTPTNYFAVQVGGSWYVATSYQLASSGALGFPIFTNATLVYTNPANVWHSLTINATDVTIGGVAAPSLTAPITGIGIVELPTTGGFDYNQVAIQAFIPNPPPPVPPTISTPISQTVFTGGGAQFLTVGSGTQPLTYKWQTNSVVLSDDGKYGNSATARLIISNATANDAAVTYSLTVTNLGGSTNAGAFGLTVNPVGPDLLYAETLPYVGPSGNLPLNGVGWAQAVSGTSRGIFQNGTGLGIFFDFSTPACTNAYFTTVTNDTGASGLPFVAINPASYPAVTFQAQFAPGNGAGAVPGNVTVYWAVQMNGVWYASITPVSQATSLIQGNYQTNQLAFKPGATNWNNLTIAGNVVTIGSQASGPLTGNITGAGVVIVHNNTAGASMNFENFFITTNALAILSPVIGANYPIDRTVASGGGASFGVSASGQLPFTYTWKTNGVTVGNGGRISGATTANLTIANVTAADDQMQLIAYVTNSAGGDESDTLTGNPTVLTVTTPPVGFIYSEDFPFVGPVQGNYSIASAGWSEAVPGSPFTLYRRGTAGTVSQGDGAVFAFLGSANTTVYYTTTDTDTNQSGLPFPNITLAAYSDLAISVDISPNSASASNVTACLAVQMNGANWYVAASALPVPNTSQDPNFTTYTTPFDPTASQWKNLTVTPGTGGSIGATAAHDLSGTMTGMGLVFVTVGSGGTFNFDNIQITGTGIGGITARTGSGGSFQLGWVGNPAVNLQSTTNLTTAVWSDVPNTLGAYSLVAPANVPQTFFRIVEH